MGTVYFLGGMLFACVLGYLIWHVRARKRGVMWWQVLLVALWFGWMTMSTAFLALVVHQKHMQAAGMSAIFMVLPGLIAAFLLGRTFGLFRKTHGAPKASA